MMEASELSISLKKKSEGNEAPGWTEVLQGGIQVLFQSVQLISPKRTYVGNIDNGISKCSSKNHEKNVGIEIMDAQHDRR